MYELACKLNKDSNEVVWPAIVGLTEQLLYEKISGEVYWDNAFKLQQSVRRHNRGWACGCGQLRNGFSMGCFFVVVVFFIVLTSHVLIFGVVFCREGDGPPGAINSMRLSFDNEYPSIVFFIVLFFFPFNPAALSWCTGQIQFCLRFPELVWF